MLKQDIDGPQAEQLELSAMDRFSKMNHIFLILEIKETFSIYMCRKAPWKWGVTSNGEWRPPAWASQVVLVGKNPSANAGNIRDAGSIPGLGRSPGGGHGNPLQYSCLENPTDRGAWWATIRRVTKSRTWLSTHTHTSPLTGEWRDKLGCIQYNKTALSKNRELSGPVTWMNPKLITLSIIRS